jgi:hypothetical protein
LDFFKLRRGIGRRTDDAADFCGQFALDLLDGANRLALFKRSCQELGVSAGETEVVPGLNLARLSDRKATERIEGKSPSRSL